MIALLISCWQYRRMVKHLWSGDLGTLGGVSEREMQTPVYFIAIGLIFIGVFAFVAVLTRALRIVLAGLIVGLAGAAGVTRVLQTFLFGVTPTDPLVFTAVTLLLLAVGLMAAWMPARRATRIDPWAALRAE